MNKFVTTVEQSKLVSKYLPKESSDLCYYCQESNPTSWELQLISVKETISMFEENLGSKWKTIWKILPAWSITSLLEILPKAVLEKNEFNRWRCKTGLGEDNLIGNYKDSEIEAIIDVIQLIYKQDNL